MRYFDSRTLSRRTRIARRSMALAGSIAALLTAYQAKAVPLYWDSDSTAAGNSISGSGLGGTGLWDSSTVTPKWWDLSLETYWTNSPASTAIFSGLPGEVTLGEAITAGGLTFTNSGYVITGAGNSLTLSNTPTISLFGTGLTTIAANVVAADLTIGGLGAGKVYLAGSNTLTGMTTIAGVSVGISSSAALGVAAVNVGVTANSNSPGSLDGRLTLAGSWATGGLTIANDLTLAGNGGQSGAAVVTVPSGALISVGNNTLTGNIRTSAGVTTRLASSYGTLKIGNGTTSTVVLGNSQSTVLEGNGNFTFTNSIGASTGNLNKSGTGTLVLNNTNLFSGGLTMSLGFVRLSSSAAVGTSTAAAAISINGGTLEIHTDAPDFTGKKVSSPDSGTIFVDRAIGGTGLSTTASPVTVAFGDLVLGNFRTLTITGRNGYNTSFTGSPAITGSASTGTANNSSGTLSLLADIWNYNAAAASLFTLSGTGDTLVTGNLLATGGTHVFTKSGVGNLTLKGTSGTFTGGMNVTAGTLTVSSIGDASGGTLNGAAGGALILSGGATLNYTGSGESTSKVINLGGTTSASVILANQTGASQTGLVFKGAVGTGGIGAKTFYLGGNASSDLVNEIGGVINNSSSGAVGLTKIGTSTWAYAPAANTYAAAVGPVNLTTGAAGQNTLVLPLTAGLTAGMPITGTSIPSGTIIVAVSSTATQTTVTMSNNIGSTALTAAAPINFGATSNFTGALTVAGGTLQIRPTTASGNGSDVIGDAVGLTFNADPLQGTQTAGGTFEYKGLAGGSTEHLGNLNVTAGAATVRVTPNGTSLTQLGFNAVGNPSIGTGLNFVVPTGGKVTLDSIPPDGFINQHTFYNGSILAVVSSGVVGPAQYDGADTSFVSTNGALVSGKHNDVLSDFNQNTVTVTSLRLSGSRTLTLNNGQTLTVNQGTNLPGTILATGGSSLITGGTAITVGGNQDLVLRVNGDTDVLEIATPITGATSGGFTKLGTGTLVLSGVNTATGTSYLDEGVVKLSTGATLGAAANALVVRQDAKLDLNGTNATVGAFSGSGKVTSGADGLATLTVGGTTTTVFSGLLQDGSTTKRLGLTKTGTGTLTLTNLTSGTLSSYTGPTTLSGGTLAVNTLADIGVSSVIGAGLATSDTTNAQSLVFNGGVLQYTGSNANFTQANQSATISTNRLFTLAGAGTIDSSGSFGNVAVGTAAQNATALVFRNTGPVIFTGSGTRTLTLTGISTGDNEIDLQLVDNAGGVGNEFGLTKNGAGLWRLGNAANSYTGNTTVNLGALQVTSSSLPGVSTVVFGGGVLQTSGEFTRNLVAAGFTVGTANQVSWTAGGGFAASNDRLSVYIGGKTAPTDLVWATGGFVANSSPLVLNSTTALFDTELFNNIDLNGAVTRTVQVDDNVNTTLDYGTLSGKITGAGGLTKTGFGLLQLFNNASSYAGNTVVSSGTLVVRTVGGSTGTSNLGTGGTLQLGTNTTLNYVGAGETADRAWQLSGTAGAVLDASGSGALVLSNPAPINGVTTSAKTLTLQGTNDDLNEIKGVLADNTGVLTLVKNGGGNWVLSGANTFTGGITANAGFIGIGADGVGSAGNITSSPLGKGVYSFGIAGGLMAIGGDRTILNNLNNPFQYSASTLIAAGDYSLTIAGTLTTYVNATVTNNIVPGKFLRIDGNVFIGDGSTTNRPLVVNGSGNTIIAGAIQNTSGTTANGVTLSGPGSLTLSGANLYTGATTVSDIGGTIIFSGSNSSAGTTTISVGTVQLNSNNNGGLASGTVTFTSGALQAINGDRAISSPVLINSGNFSLVNGNQNLSLFGKVTGSSGGTRTLVNNISGTNKTLTLGALDLSNDTTKVQTFVLGGTGNTVVSGVVANGGGATYIPNLTKVGSGNLTLTNGSNSATGTLTVNGGQLILSGGGKVAFATDTINSGAVLSLDNTGGAANDRLGGAAKVLVVSGGTLLLSGSTAATANVAENIGTLNVYNGGGTITLLPGTGSNQTQLTIGTLSPHNVSSGSLTTGGSLLIRGLSGLTGATATNFNPQAGQTGPDTNDAVTKAIRADILADASATGAGTGFLTKDSASSQLRALTSLEIASALGAGNVLNNYGNFTSTQTYSNATAVNSLTLTGSGITTMGGGQLAQGSILQRYTAAGVINTLTVNTGGILATSSTTLNLGALTTTNNVPMIFHTVGSGTTLDLNGISRPSGGLIKAGAGTLRLNMGQLYTGTTTVNDGKLILNSGAANTIIVGPSTSTSSVQPLAMNGGVLDLNGQSQAFSTLLSNNPSSNTAGSIYSLLPANLFFATSTSGNSFGGTIDGAISLYRAASDNARTLTFSSAQSYTGSTNLQGGAFVLRDNGSLASTTINILGGQLTLDNNGLADSSTRLAATSTLNFSGGVLSLIGAGGQNTKQAVGTLNFLQGGNTVSLIRQTSSSTTLTATTATRATSATVDFTGTSLGQTPGGNQLLLGSINAGSPVDLVNTNNGILGGWATVGGVDFASYVAPTITQGGVGALGTAGFNAYSTTGLATAGAIDNVTTATSVSGITTRTINSLRVSAVSTLTLASDSDRLTVGTGGVLLNGANSIVSGGQITAGVTPNSAAELYVYTNAAARLDSKIVNNGSGLVNLVKSGPALLTLTASNTYTGNTIVNGGTVTLANTSANGTTATAVPGNLTINNAATVNFSVATGSGQINQGSNVTINGGGNLTLTTLTSGANTLASITFNNPGGAGTPTVSLGVPTGTNTLTLSGANAITSVNDSYGYTPTIQAAAVASATSQTATYNNSTTITLPSVTGLVVGQGVSGPNIPLNAYITSIDGNNKIITLSDATTGGSTTGAVVTLATTATSSALVFSNATGDTNINVSGLAANGLVITTPITSVASPTGLTKLGSGLLTLNAINTFTAPAGQGVRLLDGGILVNNVNSLGANSNVLIVGDPNAAPASGGPLSLLTGTNLTVANPISLYRDLTISGVMTSAITLTESGTVNLNGASRTLTVLTPQVSLTLSGKITGGTGLTKAGTGTLTLSSAGLNDYTGSTIVAAGVLKFGSTAPLPSTSLLVVNSGAEVDTAAQGMATTSIGSLSSDSSTTGGLITNSASSSGSGATLRFGADNANATFGGVITNNVGPLNLVKIGTGTQTFAGPNTYTGSTQVTGSGTLRAVQTSGTPFGTGTMTIVGGTLALAPAGSGQDVFLLGATAASGSVFQYGGGGATLSLNKGTQNSLTYIVGGGGTAALARSGNGTLIIAPSALSNLGSPTGEMFKVTGTTPTVTNGMVVSSIVVQDPTAGNNLAGDFLNYDPSAAGFILATPTLTDSFTGSTASSIVSITSALSTPTTTTAAYALKTSAAITNTGTLNLGASGTTAGLILNGGSILGGTLGFGSAVEGTIYTSLAGGSISSNLTSNGVLTFFGPGAVTLSSTASTRDKGTFINGGTLKITNLRALYSATPASTVTVNNAAFELLSLDFSTNGPIITLNDTGATLRSTGGGTTTIGKAGGLTVLTLKSVNLEASTAADTLLLNVAPIVASNVNTAATTINVTGQGLVNIAGTASNALAGNVANNGLYTWNVTGGGKLLVTSTGLNPLGTTGNAVNVTNGTLGLASDSTTNYAFTLGGGTLSPAGGGTRTINSASTIALAAGTTSVIDLKNATPGAIDNQTLAFGGAILGSGGLKVQATGTGDGFLQLTGASNYTGPTVVDSGTLDISGSIGGSATTTVEVRQAATLQLSGAGTDRIADSATLQLSGGTVKFSTGGGLSETVGALKLAAASVIDFASGANGNTLRFSTLDLSGKTLSIYNWTGTVSMGFDDGSASGQDRLLFSSSPLFANQDLSHISFFSDNGTAGGFLGTGGQIAFSGVGGGYELIAVPEPSTPVLATMGLIGLLAFRRRRAAR